MVVDAGCVIVSNAASYMFKSLTSHHILVRGGDANVVFEEELDEALQGGRLEGSGRGGGRHDEQGWERKRE